MKKISCEQLCQIAPETLQGKIICFPTDTVYGVGVMISNYDKNVQDGFEKIYRLKNRDQSKPLPVLISKMDSLLTLISQIDELAKPLIDLWPNALTIIFPKNEKLPSFITSGAQTIAIRMPKSIVAKTVIDHLGPLSTTSINLSGSEPLNDPKLIEQHFGHLIDYLITDQDSFSSVSSTIVEIKNNQIIVLRQGNLRINV